jgi:SAM-dependent methyltransferase
MHTAGPYWDDVVKTWEPTLAHRLWRTHSDAVNCGLLQRWLPESSETLLKTDLFDEAVGRGLYPELAAHARQVHGVDVSAAAVRAARARYPDLIARVGDVRALPFESGFFDVVVSNSTLDHFDSHAQLRRAVVELRRVVRPGGTLVITLDNRLNPIVALRTSALSGKLRRIMGIPYFLGATHGPRGLARVLTGNGFEVRDLIAVMHCPPRVAAGLAARRAGPDEKHAGADEKQDEQRHLERVLRFEAMSRWPTAHLTGHFICALGSAR